MKTANEVNILDFLLPSVRPFFSDMWDLIFAHQMAFLTLFLIVLVGLTLFAWIAREVLTWFLQTKQIKKQNQILIKQNQVLVDKINAMQADLSGVVLAQMKETLISPFTPKTHKTTEGAMKGTLDTIIDEPFIESTTSVPTATEIKKTNI